jgi:hypothetical protein
MPGVKLRLVNVRPGRREGIEPQLRRDLVTLAKNGAISDAFVASANENLAEIVAEVQDLGLRVVILHITSDGGWTVPQSLRQESDDLVEISGVHLQPFVELIRGAEPANPDDQYSSNVSTRRQTSRNAQSTGTPPQHGTHAAVLPAPVGYVGPAADDYRQDAQPYADSGLPQPGMPGAYSGTTNPQPGQHNGAARGGSVSDRHAQNGYSGPMQAAGELAGYQNGQNQTGLPTDSYLSGTAQNGAVRGVTPPAGTARGAERGGARLTRHGPARRAIGRIPRRSGI